MSLTMSHLIYIRVYIPSYEKLCVYLLLFLEIPISRKSPTTSLPYGDDPIGVLPPPLVQKLKFPVLLCDIVCITLV